MLCAAAVKRRAEEEVPDEILGSEVLRVDRGAAAAVWRGRRRRRSDGFGLPVRLGELVQLVLGEELFEAGVQRRTDLLLIRI